MKKVFGSLFVFLLCVVCALSVFACSFGGNKDPEDGTASAQQKSDYDMSGIGWNYSDAFTYDGTEKTVELSGTLPSGVTVKAYSDNSNTDAGSYTASVTFNYDSQNYNEPKVADCIYTINKAEMQSVAFNDATVDYDGNPHSIAVVGNVPSGAIVKYTCNGAAGNVFTDVGEYPITCTITHKNYLTQTVQATLKIEEKISVSDVAKTIVNSLLKDKPEPWSFMPKAMSPETMAYNALPVSDFSDFVSVSSIGKKLIGKQFYVLYDGLNDAEATLGYFDNVFAIGNTIATVYQQYINNNPDNYAEFTGNVGGFKIKIVLNGSTSVLLAGNSAVSVELGYDKSSEVRYGRIQVSDGIAMKYVSSENYLKFSTMKTVKGVGVRKQIEFIRNNNAVAGYMYEFTGTQDKTLKTSAVISSNATKTVIVSDKRESDDLKINGYEEVYNSATGEFIGGEVRETVKVANFDTLWFNLYDITGFTSVKAIKSNSDTTDEDGNALNADNVYINGSANIFATKKVGGVGTKMFSRRYDVEMKEVWYVVKKTDNDGKVTYETVETKIPMLFVQIEQTDDFKTDVKKENSGLFATDPTLPASKQSSITADYVTMQASFTEIKKSVTAADVDGFIGEENAFFAKTE